MVLDDRQYFTGTVPVADDAVLGQMVAQYYCQHLQVRHGTWTSAKASENSQILCGRVRAINIEYIYLWYRRCGHQRLIDRESQRIND